MPFSHYLKKLQANLRSGHATEPTHYAALEELIEKLDPSKQVITNPKHTEVGNPDFRVQRKGHAIDFPVGYIEAKDIGDDLAKWEKDPQIQRYLDAHNFILTDFLEFRWFTDGKKRLTARLGAREGQKIRIDPNGEAAVQELLLAFLAEQLPTVRNAKELAQRMAGLAHLIRGVILGTFSREAESGHLHAQFEAFKQTLIPDLKPDQFADMYAQTIAYGLFAARCQPAPATQAFTRANAADLIPKTNPFLRKLFQEVTGVDLPDEIRPFVDDLVALLRSADLDTILADFGKRTAREDPVVHFYEDFLREYDPKEKKIRGVYYTPEPVVLYIVRSIDHLLKTRFNKPDGLADPNVLILDPACGTGTFLYYVIRHIYDHLCAKGQKGLWNSYVSQNLLKRVFGFELLMAPYAVAHLKLGLLLKELGYTFESDERLGIYLTNTLEEAIKRSEAMFAQWIADEANAAAEIKKEKPIMVVLGNPPYSGHSANRGPWIKRLIDGFVDKDGKLIEPGYKHVDGLPLGEKTSKWLQDDYVKFIRFGQWRIHETGYGILAYISNNGYLDNPTFRGMRQQLLNEFSDIYVLNLHGSSKKKERAPGGGKDENVFDIQQGVAIGLFLKQQISRHGGAAPEAGSGTEHTHHADLWGEREKKYKVLSESDCRSTSWERVQPAGPYWFFVPRDIILEEEYHRGWKLSEAMPVKGPGMTTARDHVVIDFDAKPLLERATLFRDAADSDAEVCRLLKIPKKKGWNPAKARQMIRRETDLSEFIRPIIYRPFDQRVIFYHDSLVWRTVKKVMSEMLGGHNIGLLLTRQTKDKWDALVVRHPVTHKSLSAYDITTLIPLYTRNNRKDTKPKEHPSALDDSVPRTANLSKSFTRDLNITLELTGTRGASGVPFDSYGPEDILCYIYAILYAPEYRQRYAEFLKIDFPRVPLTSDRRLFRALVEKGRGLVSLHLMESPMLSVDNFMTRFPVSGGNRVEKVRFEEARQGTAKLVLSKAEGAVPKPGRKEKPALAAEVPAGRIYINKEQYFEGVPRMVWEFHIGGYQVCEKWLKDRKGRQLTNDDLMHYQKIVVALNETIRLMREIDGVIPGWPLP